MLVVSFVIMFVFAILIWVGRGENPIDSSLLKRVQKKLTTSHLAGLFIYVSFCMNISDIYFVNVHIVVLNKKEILHTRKAYHSRDILKSLL